MTDSTTRPRSSTGDTLGLVQDSLLRRMRTMHGLYHKAVDTMELEHVNHFEREGVLPIAFSLFHYTNMHDGAFMMLTGELPTWNEEWQARVQMAIDDAGKERPVALLASPCSTATSVGSINTACATWARSNSLVASSAWRE